MARIVSFVVLVAILLVIAALFFQVMVKFLLPLFMAVLLAVMFGPLHRWFVAKCKGRDRLAAGLTTASIILILSIPLAVILIPAFFEGQAIYTAIMQSFHEQRQQAPAGVPGAADEADEARLPADAGPSDEADPAKQAKHEKAATGAIEFKDWVVSEVVRLGTQANLELKPDDVDQAIMARLREWGPSAALGTTQYVAGFLIGLAVMVISLYYFLADGPAMIRTMMRLSPLDDKYEQQLVDQFADLTRAVVVATLLSAFVQGLLAGIGFYFADLGSVFLLTALAMLLAMVPFVGTTLVWVPACLWLHFYHERTLAAVLLAVYCVVVVSMADNVIKPMVLHGRSNLHPLLALLSVLGGVQALGPIGIFVGPMVVAFLQTLLNMLHSELHSMAGGLGAAAR